MARRLPPLPVHVVASDDGRDLLDASLTLARTQLVGQLADETSLDARSMGTLGFSGALLAADLAAKSLLGTLWWAARQQLLADLAAAFARNARRIQRKRVALRAAIAILVAGLSLAALLVELDRATTIDHSHGHVARHAH